MKEASTKLPSRQPEGIDPGVHHDIWEQDYSKLIRKWTEAGAIDPPPDGDERRRFPRFKLKSKSITIQVESQFPVVDLSLSGISFLSNMAIDARQTINLVLEKTFQVEVEVVKSRKVALTEEGVDWPYRVHCRFVNPRHGMQLLVLLDEMDNLTVDTGATD